MQPQGQDSNMVPSRYRRGMNDAGKCLQGYTEEGGGVKPGNLQDLPGLRETDGAGHDLQCIACCMRSKA